MTTRTITYFPRALKMLLVSAIVLSAVFLFYQIASAQTYVNLSSQLSIGSRGSNVTTLQQFLSTDPDIYPQGLVTGYFGVLTRAAVMRFQARYGLPQVGRVGPLTLAQLNSLISAGIALRQSASPAISNVSVNVTSSTTPSAATVSWITNANAQGKVFYSTTPLSLTEGDQPGISGTVQSDNNFSTSHTLIISGLQPGTTYYYTTEAIDANGNVSLIWPQTFRTNP